MVCIAPFRGVIYNSIEMEKNGGNLVAPPYDVLNEQEQKNLLDLHPNNILHIDYGEKLPTDEHKYTWHERSAELLKNWLNEGLLQRLDKPALFHIETTCHNPIKGGNIVRHGLVCLMKLEEFSKDSQVRPHEKTFSGHKEERLSLMKHTKANVSQIFGFFPDEDRQALTEMTTVISSKKADMDFEDYRGFEHKVWINQDEESIANLVKTLTDRKVYIADGHHRYETALNYRRWLKEQGGEVPASAEYLMIYLCPMSDPGMVVFPTHRLVKGCFKHADEMLNRLSKYFKISGKSFTAETESTIRNRFLSKLKKQKNTIGLYLENRNTYYVLRLLESAKEEPILKAEPSALAQLNTIVLNNLVFREALGLSEEELDNPNLISYISDLDQALNMVKNKEQSAAFILNPSSVEDILRVTESGLIMPRKSTYFYPKVTTGLVLNLID